MAFGKRSMLGLVAAVLIVVAAAVLIRMQHGQPAPTDSAHRDFTLQNVDGKPVSLATFRGKWVLLFFGYTSCPDICPTTLLNIANTLQAMGTAAQSIQPVFVTIDPERDTAQVLKDYFANFGGHIMGLTGSAKQIADAASAYQTFYRKVHMATGGYLMDHSSTITLLSPEGKYVRAFRPDDDPPDFAKELLEAMNQEPKP
jgi:protein SCO1/2